jgi:hypothetical protein
VHGVKIHKSSNRFFVFLERTEMLPASISISGGCRHFGRFDFARHPGITKRYPGSSAFVHPGVTRRKIMALQRLLTWMRLFVGDHDCRGIREAPVEVQMASTPCEVWSLISVGPEFAPGRDVRRRTRSVARLSSAWTTTIDVIVNKVMTLSDT